MLSWDDLQHFLAVARAGSTLAAGRALHVSQTTAARRVAALEESIGVMLFERRQAGYTLTEAGHALVAYAQRVEEAATAFGEAAAGHAREATGVVRVSTSDLYAVTVLALLIGEFARTNPGIRIELDATDACRDLASGEADVVLRGSIAPDETLIGRRIAYDPWTIYCSRAYAAHHPRPTHPSDLRGHPFIGGGGERVWSQYQRWLQNQQLEQDVVMHQSNATGLLAAVRAGAGLAVLPSFIADRDPELVQVLPPHHKDRIGLWLLTHERVRRTPRVRAVMDFLGDRLSRIAKSPVVDQDDAWADALKTG